MGDKQRNLDDVAKEELSAIKNYAPGVIQAITGELSNVAKNQLAADQIYIPGKAKLQTDVYAAEAPRLNEVGAAIDRSNQLAAAETQRQIVNGAGGQTALDADALQRKIDPEFYGTRSKVSEGINRLLSSMDPTKLSGSEQAAVERGLGRTEGYFTPSALSTVRNAMTFGGELAGKQSRFGQAIATAAGSLPTLKSGVSGYQVATGRPAGPNSGDARFSGYQAGVGQNAVDIGNSFANNLSASDRVILGREKDQIDEINGWAGVGGKFIGSVAGAMM